MMLAALPGVAQDRQFSQFYASQAALNPAFAGNTIQGRLSSNYRKQWPGVSGGFTTFMVAYDHNLHRYNSGLGLVITRDRAGSGGLSTTSIAGQYAYHLQLSRSLRLRAGLQLGYGYNSLDRSRFVFTDQLLQGTSSSVEDFRFEQQSYLNVASGVVLYSRKVWLGLSG
ncbi:MAG: PorP/SprF family type IX secretion system membrane protein, partial [Bacteroidota bacterium]